MVLTFRRAPAVLANARPRRRRPRLIRRVDPNTGELLEARVENIPYHLQVVAELPRASLPTFHQSNHHLISIIESAGLRLELSCWEVRGDVVNFYNYWSMAEDANRLTFAELVLPDLPGFARFAKLWTNETKDLAIPMNDVRREPLNADSTSALAPGKQYVYVRAAHQIPFVSLSEFAARLEAGLIPFARANEWFLGDTYYALTGPAGSVVQMWVVPEEDAMFAAQRLATAPWQSLVPAPPAYQVLQPTSADPLLGSFHWPVTARQPSRSAYYAQAAQQVQRAGRPR